VRKAFLGRDQLYFESDGHGLACVGDVEESVFYNPRGESLDAGPVALTRSREPGHSALVIAFKRDGGFGCEAAPAGKGRLDESLCGLQ
jgi:hypothetical protein